jgi:hypothetical protein
MVVIVVAVVVMIVVSGECWCRLVVGGGSGGCNGSKSGIGTQN